MNDDEGIEDEERVTIRRESPSKDMLQVPRLPGLNEHHAHTTTYEQISILPNPRNARNSRCIPIIQNLYFGSR